MDSVYKELDDMINRQLDEVDFTNELMAMAEVPVDCATATRHFG